APFLTGGERNRGHAAEFRYVFEELLVAGGVFHEVGFVFFNQLAAAQGVGVIEFLVEVDVPVAVRADAFADLFPGLGAGADTLMGLEDVVGDGPSGGGIDAEGAVPGFHGGACALAQAHTASAAPAALTPLSAWPAGGITLAVVAH